MIAAAISDEGAGDRRMLLFTSTFFAITGGASGICGFCQERRARAMAGRFDAFFGVVVL
jgi:hypothetical protein